MVQLSRPADSAQPGRVLRVCVTGAESTGSTTMAQALAEHYGAEWIPEYGRQYTLERVNAGRTDPWASDEFVEIARRQCEMEDAAFARGGQLVICDTDAMSTGIWHERYLDAPHPAVDEIAARRWYDLYLLTDCDIPFEADEIRDGEHLREWMTRRFIDVLEHRAEPYVVLSGTRVQRLRLATAVIDSMLDLTSASGDVYSPSGNEYGASVG